MRMDVVIATRNRPDRLQRTLTSLAEQTAPVGRVIVVDDGSDAPCVVENTDLEVEVYRNEQSLGPAEARNRGVALAGTDIVAFIDDDVDADPAWMAAHLATQHQHGPVAAFGPLLAPPDWRPTPWNRWEAATIAVEYQRMEQGLYRPTFRQFFTGNAAVPRDAFLAAGGFDARFKRAEDVELGLRLVGAGVPFVYSPGAKGWHYSYRTLRSWRAIPRQYAFYDRMIDSLHRPGWLELLERERAGRGQASSLFLRIATRRNAGRLAIAGAVTGGVALSRGPLMPVGQKLLSLAWNGEYARELRGTCDDPEMARLRSMFSAPSAGA